MKNRQHAQVNEDRARSPAQALPGGRSGVKGQGPGLETPPVQDSGELARVRVCRHDPAAGGEPYYEEFEGIPFRDRSVLEVLHLIYLEQDPSLGYRHVCTRGSCGSCMLVVNGLPVLACRYPAQAEMTIEPHPKFPVVRDLVVDLEQNAGKDWESARLPGGAATRESPENPGLDRDPKGAGFPGVATPAPAAAGSVAADRPGTSIDLDKCVHCQDCVEVCPAGVYRSIDKRVTVTDPESCLGQGCNMCVDNCWKMAISFTGP